MIAAPLAPERQPGLLRRLTALSIVPANVAGAVAVYLYFSFVDPAGGGPVPDRSTAVTVGVAVAATMLVLNWYLGARWTKPIQRWRRRMLRGTPANAVPLAVRRRVLNAALANALLSLCAWTLAGLVYFLALRAVLAVPLLESLRVLMVIVLVGGPVTSALAFLVSEYHWRREIPFFFPDGDLPRDRVLRVPVRIRLALTFVLTSVLPLFLMLLVDLTVATELESGQAAEWLSQRLVPAQLYIVATAILTSTVMALLVARFINSPVQALRAAMADVAAGNLAVQVPVRSTDELGDLTRHFNDMVRKLQAAARARDLFGRYVSRAVAREALERGLGTEGVVVEATAMFVDLRGFTAMTQRLPVDEIVRILNLYYATVERVCEREGGVITQFLGDGVVVVFGGPLRPLADHARRAVAAAVAIERELASASDRALEAGIGICTGQMLAGNIQARERVVYTIVGDAVNQAARLQVRTRDFTARILITESTRAAMDEPPPGVRIRPCGWVALKGIEGRVEAWAVVPRDDDATERRGAERQAGG